MNSFTGIFQHHSKPPHALPYVLTQAPPHQILKSPPMFSTPMGNPSNRTVVLSSIPSPAFLHTWTTNETFQQSGKQDSLRHLVTSSASMYESSGSQFFRTTTEIQPGPDAFDESMSLMTILTILGVKEILCSFKFVLEGKTGKEIPESSRLEILGKFLANNFALSDAEDNTSRPLNRGGIADLLLLRTLLAIHQKSQEPIFWELMYSFVLLAYASLAASATFSQRLIACLNFTLDSENLFCWYK